MATRCSPNFSSSWPSLFRLPQVNRLIGSRTTSLFPVTNWAVVGDAPSSAEKKQTAEVALSLLLSLSNEPLMAEALAVEGIMALLSNDSFAAFAEMRNIYKVQYSNYLICTTIYSPPAGRGAKFMAP